MMASKCSATQSGSLGFRGCCGKDPGLGGVFGGIVCFVLRTSHFICSLTGAVTFVGLSSRSFLYAIACGCRAQRKSLFGVRILKHSLLEHVGIYRHVTLTPSRRGRIDIMIRNLLSTPTHSM
ncbi:hypothetical protein CONLIGDRAFT_437765 [Coniochaeta ligniaria NRRL 30616]|uniref:Uncharacterized protein n=1 Tax=Coniochaeta ligniaria NRRL 30616 TaxID=1408157 RepID=A0A1J7IJT6_9PEZI|nr:hypothetical protein CONLIGDRAFT_437765 [Coniochaeta ligniaria NRRL 30616]